MEPSQAVYLINCVKAVKNDALLFVRSSPSNVTTSRNRHGTVLLALRLVIPSGFYSLYPPSLRFVPHAFSHYLFHALYLSLPHSLFLSRQPDFMLSTLGNTCNKAHIFPHARTSIMHKFHFSNSPPLSHLNWTILNVKVVPPAELSHLIAPSSHRVHEVEKLTWKTRI